VLVSETNQPRDNLLFSWSTLGLGLEAEVICYSLQMTSPTQYSVGRLVADRYNSDSLQ